MVGQRDHIPHRNRDSYELYQFAESMNRVEAPTKFTHTRRKLVPQAADLPSSAFQPGSNDLAFGANDPCHYGEHCHKCNEQQAAFAKSTVVLKARNAGREEDCRYQ